MSSKNLILSIIVPVYNVEEYLEECLDSLVNQNIPEDQYEIICVNDGSTDRSEEILNKYDDKYNNILVLNKDNGGVSSARNTGIEVARGKYIWFVDADDFIKPNILSMVSKLIAEDKYDFIKIKPFAFKHDEKFTPQDIPTEMSQRSIKNFLWTYIFLREHIVKNKIYFETNISYAEDAVFMLQIDPLLIKKADIKEISYFYRQRPGSAMSQNLNKKIRSRINGALVCEEIIQGKRFGNVKTARNFKYNSVTKTMSMIVKLSRKDRKLYEKELKTNNLFPLKSNKDFIPSKDNNKSKLLKKIQNRLINNSYTKYGYIMLLTYTALINIPKRIKSILKHN